MGQINFNGMEITWQNTLPATHLSIGQTLSWWSSEEGVAQTLAQRSWSRVRQLHTCYKIKKCIVYAIILSSTCKPFEQEIFMMQNDFTIHIFHEYPEGLWVSMYLFIPLEIWSDCEFHLQCWPIKQVKDTWVSYT